MSGPTFNVRNGLLIRWLFLNITISLLILFSSGGKIHYGIKKDGSVQLFDLLQYVSILLT